MSPTLLKSEEIAAILRAHGFISHQDELLLLPDDGRGGRRGLVKSGIWFRVDSDLQALAAAARGFHQACPEIAANPLFYFDEGGWQWFGCEHENSFDELREDQLTHAVLVLESALMATDQPSTPAAAEAEIDSFLTELCQSPDFSLLDVELLLRYVGNELKARLVGSHPTTRWAHGNLTTQAIRMDASGQVRLMEPEYAKRTHFFAEDWLRLGRSGGHPSALRAYSWLRQILIHRKSLRPNLARALALLDSAGNAIRTSVLAQVAGGMGAPQEPLARGRAQLFVSPSEMFTEDLAVTVEFSRGAWECLTFVLPLPGGTWNLRLDPASEPGLIEIRRISVHHDLDGARFSSDQPGRILTASGTCSTLKNDALLLLSYGDDPQVRLPRITTESMGELTVEVWMRWRSAEIALQEYGPVLELSGTSVL